jgi:hypothetical protein
MRWDILGWPYRVVKGVTISSHALPWRKDKNILKVVCLKLLSLVYIEIVGDKGSWCLCLSHCIFLRLSVSVHIPNELRCEKAMLPDVLILLTKNKN